jgi:23S rRNA pseudouridine1911/1915/1917 synthase
MGAQKLELVVSTGGEPERLDIFLAKRLTEMSRSRIRKLIDEGHITVDGKAGKAGQPVKGGERISVLVPEAAPLLLAAQEIPLAIVFQDEYLAVINKPAGLVVHPGAGVADGTLVNALLYLFAGQLSGISGIARPGIVHRLDKDTSGLLVVAKEDKAHRHLSEQIRAKTARRVYLALLEGQLANESGVVSKPIARDRTHRKRMAIVETGRQATSHYEVLKRWPAYTLARIALETGRTHQIRVHMASIGHPVVGDIVYNKKRTGSLSARQKLGLSGHALHAAYLSFTHPVSQALLEFEAQVPEDFQHLLDRL